MRSTRRRGALIFSVAAVVLAVSAVAYACQVLATMQISPRSGAPGTRVTGTGANYSSRADASDVVVRLKNRTGQVLWRGRAGDDGRINFSFSIPRVQPGDYAVIATQFMADGSPKSGTPGRNALRVTRAGGSRAEMVPPARSSGPADGQPTLVVEPQRAPGLVDGSVLLALLALAGVGSLSGLAWRKASRRFAASSL